MSKAVLDRLSQKFAHAIVSSHARLGNETVVIHAEDLVSVCEFLRDDAQCKMNMLIDVTAVDWPEREPRFDVVYHVYSLEKKHRLRLKVQVPVEKPNVQTITTVWKGANWFERETYDMYGIIFEGHPNLTRVLLYPEFRGHPLRKDYEIGKTQPLIENRQRNVDYGVRQGIAGDPTIVQIGGLGLRNRAATAAASDKPTETGGAK